MAFNGLNMGLGNIAKLAETTTCLISAENVYGEKGKGGMAEVTDTPQPEVKKIGQQWEKSTVSRELGQKGKVRPQITLPADSTTTLMDIDGPGTVQHIWITVGAKTFRDLIIRVYWDDEKEPSIETPIGDFFCNGFDAPTNILALPINVNPTGGLNCYFPMPFRKHARMTV